MDNESMDEERMGGWTGHGRLETDGGVANRWREDRKSGKDFMACTGGVKTVETV